MPEKTIIPILENTPDESENKGESCNACGKGGCCGGFGIKVGSEKDVVYRNIYLYTAMGIILFTATYIIMQLLNRLL
jgi:hypothetical protein